MEKGYRYSDLNGKIIGAAIRVHNTLGCGFQEVIYQRALKIEFDFRRIRNEREYAIQIYYEGNKIGSRRVDFLVEEKIPVEIKAVTQLEDIHMAQAKNYLEAFNLEIGLLINFGGKSLEFRRLINDNLKAPQSSPPHSSPPSQAPSPSIP